MSGSMQSDHDDPLAIVAAPRRDSVMAARLRDELLRQTTGVVRRRRRVRRVLTAAAMAGCYLAGIATWHVVATGLFAAGMQRQSLATAGADAAPANVPVETATPRLTNEPAPSPSPSIPRPKREELSRFAALCSLGDRNLLDRGDPEAATRAYRMALRYATAEERARASTEGTWLFRAINLSYQPESDHVPSAKANERS